MLCPGHPTHKGGIVFYPDGRRRYLDGGRIIEPPTNKEGE